MTREAEARSWIGKALDRHDVASARLAAEFEATLQPYLAATEGVPLGFHWCLCPDILPNDKLGKDGHPLPGLFLPDTGLPRRMWAGGEINYHGAIRVGDTVRRVSTIEDVIFKEGRSGKLCFVTVRHHYSVAGTLLIDDRQDIVYRAESAVGGAPQTTIAIEDPQGAVKITASPTLLFRYSAVTFNGHRIHYDEPYAITVEHYPGLVVHGPMQATLMLNLATERLGRQPKRFSYRGVNPLICGQAFHVDASKNAKGGFDTQVINSSGNTTMTGSVD
jgi:3-methylfumaryl-CoA hydratase